MAATHDLHLLESEESDIRWAANEDAEKTRINLINELTTANAIISEHQRGDKMLCELLGSETIAEGIEKLKRAAAMPNAEVSEPEAKP